MEVCDQLHALAASPPQKEPMVPTGQDTQWAPELVWMWWQKREKKKIPAPAANQIPVIQPVA